MVDLVLWSIMIVTSLTSMAEGSIAINSDILAAYHNVCPYNSLCTSGPLVPYNGTLDTVPCCEQCQCDEQCWVRNDCCPDVTHERPDVVDELTCRPTAHFYALDNYLQYERRLHGNSYLVKDSCPEDADPDLKQKCSWSQNTDIDDMIAVSNKARPYEIYLNKHCARCNGVFDWIPWHLQADGCERKYLVRATESLTAMHRYLREQCILRSLPPVESLAVRLPVCESAASSQCTSSGLDTEDGAVFGELCESQSHLLVIEHKDTKFGKLRHKNPFCFACNRVPELSESLETCTKDLFEPPPYEKTMKDFTLILGTRKLHSDDPGIKYPCNETSIYDHRKSECRKLYCPNFQHPHYGKCMSIVTSVPDILMVVHFVLFPESPSLEGHLDSLSESSRQEIIQMITKSLNLEKCKTDCTRITVFHYRDTMEVLSLNVRLEIYPSADPHCTRIAMATNFATEFGKFRKYKVNLNDIPMNMKGRIDVFEPAGMPMFHVPDLVTSTRLYSRYGKAMLKDTQRLSCPYVKFDVDEFCSFVEQYQNRTCNRNVTLDMPENMFDDLFSIDENSVGICVETYKRYTSAASRENRHGVMIVSVLIVLMSLTQSSIF